MIRKIEVVLLIWGLEIGFILIGLLVFPFFPLVSMACGQHLTDSIWFRFQCRYKQHIKGNGPVSTIY